MKPLLLTEAGALLPSRTAPTLVFCISLLVCILCVQGAIVANNFNDQSRFQFNGYRRIDPSGYLELTDGYSGGQISATYYKTPFNVSASLEWSIQFTFRFRVYQSFGADGLGLIVQSNTLTTMGNGGGALSSDIPNSWSLIFDTWQNGPFCAGDVADASSNCVRLQVGISPGCKKTIGQRDLGGLWLKDGQWHSARITQRQGSGGPNSRAIDVYVDNVLQFTVPNFSVANTMRLLPGDMAYVGFVSATGGAMAAHQIGSLIASTLPKLSNYTFTPSGVAKSISSSRGNFYVVTPTVLTVVGSNFDETTGAAPACQFTASGLSYSTTATVINPSKATCLTPTRDKFGVAIIAALVGQNVTLRFSNDGVQFASTSVYLSMFALAGDGPTLPASTCQHALDIRTAEGIVAPTGIYYLRDIRVTNIALASYAYPIVCDQTTSGGGWALVAKIPGADASGTYSFAGVGTDPFWSGTAATTLGTVASSSLSMNDTNPMRNQGFGLLPVQDMRLGFSSVSPSSATNISYVSWSISSTSGNAPARALSSLMASSDFSLPLDTSIRSWMQAISPNFTLANSSSPSNQFAFTPSTVCSASAINLDLGNMASSNPSSSSSLLKLRLGIALSPLNDQAIVDGRYGWIGAGSDKSPISGSNSTTLSAFSSQAASRISYLYVRSPSYGLVAPQGLQCSPISNSSSSLRLNWWPLFTGSLSGLSSYLVRWVSADGSSVASNFTAVASTASTISVANLPLATLMNFTITPTTLANPTPNNINPSNSLWNSSTIQCWTGADAPASLRLVSRPIASPSRGLMFSSATLEWNDPPLASARLSGMSIASYKVSLAPSPAMAGAQRSALTCQQPPNSPASSATITIDSLVPNSQYIVTVRALTYADSNNAAATMTLVTTPNSPTNVTVRILGATSANVSWVAPRPAGNMLLNNYTVIATPVALLNGQPAPAPVQVWTVKTPSSVVINGLQAATNYSFTVQANNDVWSSEPSLMSTRTIASTCFLAPSSTAYVQATSNTTAVLALPPMQATPSGAVSVSEYIVVYGPSNPVFGPLQTMTTTNASLLFNLTNMRPNTAYNVSVRFSTATGSACASNLTFIGCACVPTNMTAFVRSTSVLLSWVPPPFPPISGAIVFDYQITDTAGFIWASGVPSTSATIAGLQAGTTYSFLVTQRTSSGFGPSSSVLTFTTLSPPSLVRVTPDKLQYNLTSPITIDGIGFQNWTTLTVRFTGVRDVFGRNVTFVNSTRILALSPGAFFSGMTALTLQVANAPTDIWSSNALQYLALGLFVPTPNTGVSFGSRVPQIQLVGYTNPGYSSFCRWNLALTTQIDPYGFCLLPTSGLTPGSALNLTIETSSGQQIYVASRFTLGNQLFLRPALATLSTRIDLSGLPLSVGDQCVWLPLGIRTRVFAASGTSGNCSSPGQPAGTTVDSMYIETNNGQPKSYPANITMTSAISVSPSSGITATRIFLNGYSATPNTTRPDLCVFYSRGVPSTSPINATIASCTVPSGLTNGSLTLALVYGDGSLNPKYANTSFVILNSKNITISPSLGTAGTVITLSSAQYIYDQGDVCAFQMSKTLIWYSSISPLSSSTNFQCTVPSALAFQPTNLVTIFVAYNSSSMGYFNVKQYASSFLRLTGSLAPNPASGTAGTKLALSWVSLNDVVKVTNFTNGVALASLTVSNISTSSIGITIPLAGLPLGTIVQLQLYHPGGLNIKSPLTNWTTTGILVASSTAAASGTVITLSGGYTASVYTAGDLCLWTSVSPSTAAAVTAPISLSGTSYICTVPTLSPYGPYWQLAAASSASNRKVGLLPFTSRYTVAIAPSYGVGSSVVSTVVTLVGYLAGPEDAYCRWTDLFVSPRTLINSTTKACAVGAGMLPFKTASLSIESPSGVTITSSPLLFRLQGNLTITPVSGVPTTRIWLSNPNITSSITQPDRCVFLPANVFSDVSAAAVGSPHPFTCVVPAFSGSISTLHLTNYNGTIIKSFPTSFTSNSPLKFHPPIAIANTSLVLTGGYYLPPAGDAGEYCLFASDRDGVSSQVPVVYDNVTSTASCALPPVFTDGTLSVSIRGAADDNLRFANATMSQSSFLSFSPTLVTFNTTITITGNSVYTHAPNDACVFGNSGLNSTLFAEIAAPGDLYPKYSCIVPPALIYDIGFNTSIHFTIQTSANALAADTYPDLFIAPEITAAPHFGTASTLVTMVGMPSDLVQPGDVCYLVDPWNNYARIGPNTTVLTTAANPWAMCQISSDITSFIRIESRNVSIATEYRDGNPQLAYYTFTLLPLLNMNPSSGVSGTNISLSTYNDLDMDQFVAGDLCLFASPASNIITAPLFFSTNASGSVIPMCTIPASFSSVVGPISVSIAYSDMNKKFSLSSAFILNSNISLSPNNGVTGTNVTVSGLGSSYSSNDVCRFGSFASGVTSPLYGSASSDIGWCLVPSGLTSFSTVSIAVDGNNGDALKYGSTLFAVNGPLAFSPIEGSYGMFNFVGDLPVQNTSGSGLTLDVSIYTYQAGDYCVLTDNSGRPFQIPVGLNPSFQYACQVPATQDMADGMASLALYGIGGIRYLPSPFKVLTRRLDTWPPVGTPGTVLTIGGPPLRAYYVCVFLPGAIRVPMTLIGSTTSNATCTVPTPASNAASFTDIYVENNLKEPRTLKASFTLTSGLTVTPPAGAPSSILQLGGFAATAGASGAYLCVFSPAFLGSASTVFSVPINAAAIPLATCQVPASMNQDGPYSLSVSYPDGNPKYPSSIWTILANATISPTLGTSSTQVSISGYTFTPDDLCSWGQSLYTPIFDNGNGGFSCIAPSNLADVYVAGSNNYMTIVYNSTLNGLLNPKQTITTPFTMASTPKPTPRFGTFGTQVIISSDSGVQAGDAVLFTYAQNGSNAFTLVAYLMPVGGSQFVGVTIPQSAQQNTSYAITVFYNSLSGSFNPKSTTTVNTHFVTTTPMILSTSSALLSENITLSGGYSTNTYSPGDMCLFTLTGIATGLGSATTSPIVSNAGPSFTCAVPQLPMYGPYYRVSAVTSSMNPLTTSDSLFSALGRFTPYPSVGATFESSVGSVRVDVSLQGFGAGPESTFCRYGTDPSVPRTTVDATTGSCPLPPGLQPGTSVSLALETSAGLPFYAASPFSMGQVLQVYPSSGIANTVLTLTGANISVAQGDLCMFLPDKVTSPVLAVSTSIVPSGMVCTVPANSGALSQVYITSSTGVAKLFPASFTSQAVASVSPQSGIAGTLLFLGLNFPTPSFEGQYVCAFYPSSGGSPILTNVTRLSQCPWASGLTDGPLQMAIGLSSGVFGTNIMWPNITIAQRHPLPIFPPFGTSSTRVNLDPNYRFAAADTCGWGSTGLSTFVQSDAQGYFCQAPANLNSVVPANVSLIVSVNTVDYWSNQYVPAARLATFTPALPPTPSPAVGMANTTIILVGLSVNSSSPGDRCVFHDFNTGNQLGSSTPILQSMHPLWSVCSAPLDLPVPSVSTNISLLTFFADGSPQLPAATWTSLAVASPYPSSGYPAPNGGTVITLHGARPYISATDLCNFQPQSLPSATAPVFTVTAQNVTEWACKIPAIFARQLSAIGLMNLTIVSSALNNKIPTATNSFYLNGNVTAWPSNGVPGTAVMVRELGGRWRQGDVCRWGGQSSTGSAVTTALDGGPGLDYAFCIAPPSLNPLGDSFLLWVDGDNGTSLKFGPALFSANPPLQLSPQRGAGGYNGLFNGTIVSLGSVYTSLTQFGDYCMISDPSAGKTWKVPILSNNNNTGVLMATCQLPSESLSVGNATISVYDSQDNIRFAPANFTIMAAPSPTPTVGSSRTLITLSDYSLPTAPFTSPEYCFFGSDVANVSTSIAAIQGVSPTAYGCRVPDGLPFGVYMPVQIIAAASTSSIGPRYSVFNLSLPSSPILSHADTANGASLNVSLDVGSVSPGDLCVFWALGANYLTTAPLATSTVSAAKSCPVPYFNLGTPRVSKQLQIGLQFSDGNNKAPVGPFRLNANISSLAPVFGTGSTTLNLTGVFPVRSGDMCRFGPSGGLTSPIIASMIAPDTYNAVTMGAGAVIPSGLVVQCDVPLELAQQPGAVIPVWVVTIDGQPRYDPSSFTITKPVNAHPTVGSAGTVVSLSTNYTYVSGDGCKFGNTSSAPISFIQSSATSPSGFACKTPQSVLSLASFTSFTAVRLLIVYPGGNTKQVTTSAFTVPPKLQMVPPVAPASSTLLSINGLYTFQPGDKCFFDPLNGVGPLVMYDVTPQAVNSGPYSCNGPVPANAPAGSLSGWIASASDPQPRQSLIFNVGGPITPVPNSGVSGSRIVLSNYIETLNTASLGMSANADICHWKNSFSFVTVATSTVALNASLGNYACAVPASLPEGIFTIAIYYGDGVTLKHPIDQANPILFRRNGVISFSPTRGTIGLNVLVSTASSLTPAALTSSDACRFEPSGSLSPLTDISPSGSQARCRVPSSVLGSNSIADINTLNSLGGLQIDIVYAPTVAAKFLPSAISRLLLNEPLSLSPAYGASNTLIKLSALPSSSWPLSLGDLNYGDKCVFSLRQSAASSMIDAAALQASPDAVPNAQVVPSVQSHLQYDSVSGQWMCTAPSALQGSLSRPNVVPGQVETVDFYVESASDGRRYPVSDWTVTAPVILSRQIGAAGDLVLLLDGYNITRSFAPLATVQSSPAISDVCILNGATSPIFAIPSLSAAQATAANMSAYSSLLVGSSVYACAVPRAVGAGGLTRFAIGFQNGNPRNPGTPFIYVPLPAVDKCSAAQNASHIFAAVLILFVTSKSWSHLATTLILLQFAQSAAVLLKFKVPWGAAGGMLDALGHLSINIDLMFGPCTSSVGFAGRTATTLLSPGFMLIGIFLWRVLLLLMPDSSRCLKCFKVLLRIEKAQETIQDLDRSQSRWAMPTLFVLLFALYSFLVDASMRPLVCLPQPDGSFAADDQGFLVPCNDNSPEWRSSVAVGSIGFIAYVLGWPLILYFALKHHGSSSSATITATTTAITAEEEPPSLASISSSFSLMSSVVAASPPQTRTQFVKMKMQSVVKYAQETKNKISSLHFDAFFGPLHSMLKPQNPMFAAFVCCRLGLLVLFQVALSRSTTTAALSVCLALQIAALCVQVFHFQPYRTFAIGRLDILQQGTLIFALIIGLIMNSSASSDSPTAAVSKFLAAVLIIGLLFTAFVLIANMVREWHTRSKLLKKHHLLISKCEVFARHTFSPLTRESVVIESIGNEPAFRAVALNGISHLTRQVARKYPSSSSFTVSELDSQLEQIGRNSAAQVLASSVGEANDKPSTSTSTTSSSFLSFWKAKFSRKASSPSAAVPCSEEETEFSLALKNSFRNSFILSELPPDVLGMMDSPRSLSVSEQEHGSVRPLSTLVAERLRNSFRRSSSSSSLSSSSSFSLSMSDAESAPSSPASSLQRTNSTSPFLFRLSSNNNSNSNSNNVTSTAGHELVQKLRGIQVKSAELGRKAVLKTRELKHKTVEASKKFADASKQVIKSSSSSSKKKPQQGEQGQKEEEEELTVLEAQILAQHPERNAVLTQDAMRVLASLVANERAAAAAAGSDSDMHMASPLDYAPTDLQGWLVACLSLTRQSELVVDHLCALLQGDEHMLKTPSQLMQLRIMFEQAHHIRLMDLDNEDGDATAKLKLLLQDKKWYKGLKFALGFEPLDLVPKRLESKLLEHHNSTKAESEPDTEPVYQQNVAMEQEEEGEAREVAVEQVAVSLLPPSAVPPNLYQDLEEQQQAHAQVLMEQPHHPSAAAPVHSVVPIAVPSIPATADVPAQSIRSLLMSMEEDSIDVEVESGPPVSFVPVAAPAPVPVLAAVPELDVQVDVAQEKQEAAEEEAQEEQEEQSQLLTHESEFHTPHSSSLESLAKPAFVPEEALFAHQQQQGDEQKEDPYHFEFVLDVEAESAMQSPVQVKPADEPDPVAHLPPSVGALLQDQDDDVIDSPFNGGNPFDEDEAPTVQDAPISLPQDIQAPLLALEPIATSTIAQEKAEEVEQVDGERAEDKPNAVASSSSASQPSRQENKSSNKSRSRKNNRGPGRKRK